MPFHSVQKIPNDLGRFGNGVSRLFRELDQIRPCFYE